MVVCGAVYPGTEETAADDEEHGCEAEAEDGPPLAKSLLLNNLLFVCHFGGVVGIERQGGREGERERERVCVRGCVRYWRNCWSERDVIVNELLYEEGEKVTCGGRDL